MEKTVRQFDWCRKERNGRVTSPVRSHGLSLCIVLETVLKNLKHRTDSEEFLRLGKID